MYCFSSSKFVGLFSNWIKVFPYNWSVTYSYSSLYVFVLYLMIIGDTLKEILLTLLTNGIFDCTDRDYK